MDDLIRRQDAIDNMAMVIWGYPNEVYPQLNDYSMALGLAKDGLMGIPSAQQERDIPVKPNETTDKTWGIPKRQAVCPKCDYYLGHVAFLGYYKGKRITYCETCGQAIDWEGWEFDE